MISLFFQTCLATRQRILKISLSRISSCRNLAISKSPYLENAAILNFLSGPFMLQNLTKSTLSLFGFGN